MKLQDMMKLTGVKIVDKPSSFHGELRWLNTERGFCEFAKFECRGIVYEALAPGFVYNESEPWRSISNGETIPALFGMLSFEQSVTKAEGSVKKVVQGNEMGRRSASLTKAFGKLSGFIEASDLFPKGGFVLDSEFPVLVSRIIPPFKEGDFLCVEGRLDIYPALGLNT